MDTANAFFNGVGADIAPRVNGQKDLEEAISNLFAARSREPDKPSVKLLDDESEAFLNRVVTRVLTGVLLAISTYWIVEEDFMTAVVHFYSSEVTLTFMLWRQISGLVWTDGRFDQWDLTALGNYGVVTTAFVFSCAIIETCIPLLWFLLRLDAGQTTWVELASFWLSLFSVWTFWHFSQISLPTAYHAFRRVDNIAKTPQKLLHRGFLRTLRTLLWKIQTLLNWLLYHYYRLDAKDLPYEWMIKPYEYAKLSSARHIRLLKIPKRFLGETREFHGLLIPFPGNCELKHCLIEDAEPYECISYTWGSGLQTRNIEIDGKSVPVSQTVYDILCERRSLVQDRFIWIDSICIDQQNLDEKGEQVPLMTEIYSRASRVVVHLGAPFDPDKSLQVTALIRKLALFPGAVASELRGIASNAMFRNYDGTPEWNALLEFLSHPFFSRVWVVQEIAVASDLAVVVGNNYTPWGLMTAAIRNVSGSGLIKYTSRHGLHDRSPLENATHFRRMTAMRNTLCDGGVPRLARVLSTFHTFDATNPRDKVFALKGISDAKDDDDLPVDYKIDTCSLVCQTARCLVKRGQYFEVVYAAGTGWREQKDGVPSWVPDWTVQPAGPKGFRFLDSLEEAPFSASGSHAARLQVSLDGKSCTAFGARIGHVAKLSEPLSMSDEDVDTATKFTEGSHIIISKWMSDVRSLVEAYFPETCDENEGFNHDQMLLATIVGGRDNQGSYVSSEFLEKVRAWESQMKQPSVLEEKFGKTEDLSAMSARVPDLVDFKAVQEAMGNTGQSYGARLAIIDENFTGLVPPRTREGDMVCILSGAHTPVLLRRRSGPAPNNTLYELVGTCYIQGAMLGELSHLLEDLQEFELR
jgi:hypothetical protein